MKQNKLDRRTLAGLICREPRGFHKGAKLAGAKCWSESDRRNLIAARSRARAELEASDTRQ